MSDPKDYTVGWICAISTERVAAVAFLDETHDEPESISVNDNNDYTLGRVGRHNVAIAVLPDGGYGIASAAGVARDMLHTFPNVRIGLMVGIGGGAPSRKHDIRLGDIVVGTPCNGKSSIFQHDFDLGKMMQDQSFITTGILNQPPTILRTAIAGLKAQYEVNGHTIEEAITDVLAKKPRLRRKYQRPEPSSDRLYQSQIIHPNNEDSTCTLHCGTDSLIVRSERGEEEDNPTIHYGTIASGNQLIRDASIRDKMALENGVLCFETEAAGLMNQIPCLVIRGICDYSDSHKNEEWQGYASMTAAAYAKELLSRIPPNKIEAERKISSEVLEAVTRIAGKVHIMSLRDERQGAFDILNWLTSIDYGIQQSDIFRRQELGTGQWLLESPVYQSWRNSNAQTLLCPGLLGAEFTTLTSIVVNDLLTHREEQKEGVAYIYFNSQWQSGQNIRELMANLLKQLVGCRPPLLANLKDLYQNHDHGQTQASYEEILKSLQSVFPSFDRVFIVLDALDQCQTSFDCREKLLQWLFSMQEERPVNIFATSRFFPGLFETFEGSLKLKVRAKNDEILDYLKSRMRHGPSNVEDDPEIEPDTLSLLLELVEMTSGATDIVILLTEMIYVGLLEDKLTHLEIRNTVKSLWEKSLANGKDIKFETLEKAYMQTMGHLMRKRSVFQKLGTEVFSWVESTTKPFKTLELQQVLKGKFKKK